MIENDRVIWWMIKDDIKENIKAYSTKNAKWYAKLSRKGYNTVIPALKITLRILYKLDAGLETGLYKLLNTSQFQFITFTELVSKYSTCLTILDGGTKTTCMEHTNPRIAASLFTPSPNYFHTHMI
ncbi:hypothetical protein T09_14722 [Trichinella sp. T9]|nr:hypothetical protein T09_14722 [Trichinella sp. T9]